MVQLGDVHNVGKPDPKASQEPFGYHLPFVTSSIHHPK